jgi:hypothetical protein
LAGQAIGNALYGLQSMSSDKGEVREIILALILKIVRCNQELTGQNVGNMLYGLQSMSSDQEEVEMRCMALN